MSEEVVVIVDDASVLIEDDSMIELAISEEFVIVGANSWNEVLLEFTVILTSELIDGCGTIP